MILNKSNPDSIFKTSDILKKGGICILPTDTVYGFSSVVCNENENKIKNIKGRAENKPFIQLISSPKEISMYTDDYIPESLISFWPGPLTIILNDKRNPGKTTAFRCPGDEWIRSVIKETGNPIFSTSVNHSGLPVLTLEKDIVSEFEKEVDLIVLDGDSKGTVPSTIVKIQEGNIIVVREGAVKL
ncbi:MAG: threonylcarbamoyl-AMP synthase [Treponema sp.]|nr:threonylcarbamoyl-AMP synthase [Treponema sp.]